MVEGRLVHPVQDYELGAQVQSLHGGAAQVDDLGGRGVPTLQNQCQADVLDTASGEVDLVDVAILHYGACER